MKRLFKILAGLIGLVVLLFVLAAVLLPIIYDKEDMEAALAGQVYEQTGRELSIAGGLDISVFPWLAVEVKELSLSNAPGFGEQPFAKIGQARVGVALMPLFRKQVVIDEVTLDGLDLALAVNEKGQTNWDDLADGQDPGTPQDSDADLFSGKRVAGLNIQNARVEYRDQQAGSHFRLGDFSLQTGALGEGRPVPLELSALVEDVIAGGSAVVEMTATASIDLEAEKYRLDDFALSLDSQDAPPVTLLAPRLDMDLAAQTLQLESFKAEIAGLQLEGAVSGQKILDDPVFSGSFETGEFSPAEVMDKLGAAAPRTTDPAVLQRARMSANFSGSGTRFALTDFTAELDDSRFTGELEARNFDRPNIGFTFAVDAIDLDRYLEPADEAAGPDEVAMPQEELKGMELQGKLQAGTLRMTGLEFSDAEVGIVLRNGKLRLNPLTAGFYGGRYNGDVSLDSSGAEPLLSLDEKIDGITFQRLVADLVESESLSGVAMGRAKLSGVGRTSSQVLGSLQGDLGLTLTEGALEGINIWYEIRRGMALFKGLPPPAPEPDRTVFSRLSFDAGVDGGIISPRELIGELPFLTVQGNGTVDLGRSEVDLAMVAKVRNSPDLAQDALGSELRGKSMPFKITGPLDDPKLSVDWESLLKSQATDLIIDKLGLGTSKDGEDAAADGEQADGETSSSDQLEKAATSALMDLLGGKKKDKDKDKDGGGN